MNLSYFYGSFYLLNLEGHDNIWIMRCLSRSYALHLDSLIINWVVHVRTVLCYISYQCCPQFSPASHL